MDEIDNSILCSIFVSSLIGGDPVKLVRQKSNLSEEFVNDRILSLRNNGLIEKEKYTLTEVGRTSLRVVLTGGVFDIIHPGHIHTLNSAKELGNVLVVVVATDDTAEKMKKRRPLHNQNERRVLVNSLSMVDLCIIGQKGDIFKTVEFVNPQIIALGYDQVHQEKFITDGCKKLNLDIKVARLQSPVPEISSSKIEKEYGDAIHDI
ncbi:cytidyltransferase [Nitrosopumilus sp. b1]|uniref:adenylyltransferase/cytidyltransferase family protein n=1 Tax=Nitrosopumilus sp. b1 TaxID=2109907 RepID=UPI0015F3BF25|nr:adenylyltransferase/cytidyltransferase family protein [Nitrosopumilus sp. b1]KAF6243754.1 cytidyltransferase [Nitrosopumilus sp. b1]